MTTLELKLNLPDQLARDAKAAGLLTEPELERPGTGGAARAQP